MRPKPRSALNIDIVRAAVVAADPASARAALASIGAAFGGGFSLVKVLPDLAGTNAGAASVAAAEERHHLLPVLATVLLAPVGLTVGALASQPAVVAVWAARRAGSLPEGGINRQQFVRDHDAAVAALVRCSTAPVRMHCEIQLLLSEAEQCVLTILTRKLHEASCPCSLRPHPEASI
jgi:hypothetical protein